MEGFRAFGAVGRCRREEAEGCERRDRAGPRNEVSDWRSFHVGCLRCLKSRLSKGSHLEARDARNRARRDSFGHRSARWVRRSVGSGSRIAGRVPRSGGPSTIRGYRQPLPTFRKSCGSGCCWSLESHSSGISERGGERSERAFRERPKFLVDGKGEEAGLRLWTRKRCPERQHETSSGVLAFGNIEIRSGEPARCHRGPAQRWRSGACGARLSAEFGRSP
jgi:hypothetical protein